jgi:NADH:ubiquinone oxidoreductase subunit E
VSSDDQTVDVVVCLGSSCFARGNSENLEILNRYVQRRDSSIRIRLTGRLCQDQCKQGPNLMIAGELHHNVSATKLLDLLQHFCKQDFGKHGTT